MVGICLCQQTIVKESVTTNLFFENKKHKLFNFYIAITVYWEVWYTLTEIITMDYKGIAATGSIEGRGQLTRHRFSGRDMGSMCPSTCDNI